MKRVVVGGTFEFLHKGHRALLRKAFEIGDSIIIGITADGFKEECGRSFEERKRIVENFIKNFGKEFQIVKINDKFGPTLREDFDLIVVSRETRKTAEEINEVRRKKGMKEMEIVEIPIFYAEDLLPISSRRIRVFVNISMKETFFSFLRYSKPSISLNLSNSFLWFLFRETFIVRSNNSIALS